MKKLSFLLITLFFLTSCAEDEPTDDTSLTSEEAITSLEQASDQIDNDVIDMIESDGLYSMMEASVFLDHFLSYSNQARTDLSKDQILGLYEFFIRKPVSRLKVDEPSNEIPSGLFEWDSTLEDFVEDPNYDGTDLILKFPVGDSETNNGMFKLTEFLFTDSGLPKSVELFVYVDDAAMVELNLNVNWSAQEFPQDAEVYLFLNPFTLVAQFNLTDGLDTDLSVTVANGDEQIVSIGLTASGQDIFNDMLPEISGHIEYRWVKLEGAVDLQGMEESFENGTDPNESLDLDLKIEGEKVGEIVLILETQEDYTDYVPYIEFNDGELFAIEEFLEEIIVSLEEELNTHSL